MAKKAEIAANIAIIASLLSIIGVMWAAYSSLNKAHAPSSIEVELRQEILDTDINRNAKIRHHYDQIEMERELTKPEANRKRYVEEELERQYAEQNRLRKLQDAIE